MKRLCCAVVSLLLVASATAKEAVKPSVRVLCSAGKTSYTPGDNVDLAISIHNQGSSALYVFKTIEWGWTGLRFRLMDSAGHAVTPRAGSLPIPPPPPPANKSQFVELDEGYFYGAHQLFPLNIYDVRPGTYFIQVSYQSYYKSSDVPGVRILTSDDGEFRSNKVEIHVVP
jgi:hypothetical protein